MVISKNYLNFDLFNITSFRTYGAINDFLSCTIGHELSHVIFNDHIEQAIKLSDDLEEFKNFKGTKFKNENIEEKRNY